MCDVRVTDHGSIYLFLPVSEEAETWVDENVSDEARRWNGAVVVEPRYCEGLAVGMAEAGLRVG